MTQLPWRAAIRIAWRELRASRAKFFFVVLAVAVGVGSLTGVRGFSRSFRHMLLSEARTLMAGDMTLRVFSLPSPEQQAALDGLAARGVRRTWITETVTMASSASTPDPLLISVKAVDPAAYPYYGTVKLNPPRPLREALDANSVVVSDDLLLRLNVRTGDTLRIGGQDFRIAGVVTGEPDRMTGSLNVGPRVMVTRAGLDRTGLISVGSRASERYLFALPAQGGPDVDQVRATLKQAFPEATIADYRETHPIITRGLDRSTTFLSLIALIALVIGAMGVASAMHGHLQQKLDSIAVMKCIGARSAQVIRIYVAQTLMLGLGGGLIGVIFGVLVASAFPGFIAKYFDVDVASYWDAWPALQGIAVACLITLLFTVPPLLGIRDIRPAVIFRRSVDAAARPRPAWLARIAILLGTGAVAATLTEGSWRDTLRTAAYFTAALAVGIGLLSLTGWLMLRAFRALLRRAGARLPGAVRHGIANLYRPGNQAQAAVVSLGVGVMFTLTVFLVQGALVDQIRGSAPRGMPNVFLLDIPANQKQALSHLIQAQPGVKEAPDVAYAVAAKIAAINGQPIEQRPLRNFDRRFLRTRSVTSLDAIPPDAVILAGTWWKPGDRAPQVCVAEEPARILGLKPGDVIDWSIWSRDIRTTRGMRGAHGIDPDERTVRVPLQPGTAGRTSRRLLRQRAGESGGRTVAAARGIPAVSHRHRSEHRGRDADRGGRSAAHRHCDPLHLRVHRAGRRRDGRVERGGHALPPYARGGHSKDTGRDPATHRVDFFGGVSGAGYGGRSDGDGAGLRLRRGGAAEVAGDRFPSESA